MADDLDQNDELERPPILGASHVDFSDFGDDAENIDLIRRRQSQVAGSLLFYHDPVHIVRGEGVWLYDDKGRKYLDCYNNVASVGHCHPKVVAALTEQAGKLNTHTRYLHEGIVEYSEKLTGLMPEGLDVCYFVCTGTEANDLAMRIARAVTGKNGIIVMENSYHGNSTLIHEASTVGYPASDRPDHIVAVEPPNCYRGPYRSGEHEELGPAYAELVGQAIATLDNRGQGVAAFLCDTIFDSQGVIEAPEDYFREIYKKVREAGGLCIADEVQAGLCRTGKYWGFEHYGITPDIVTLGKPMGDGHPLAIVVTSREIAAKFAQHSFYFNTFGGNPVSMAVGKAVLEVCEEEAIAENARETGMYLREQLEVLAQRYPVIGDVKGKGLFQAIELVEDRETREPATKLASQLPDRMKQHGVLIGLSGRYGNTLKVRPPLTFSKANVDQLVLALDSVLS